MASKIGTGLMYYGRFEQSITFVFISIAVIIGTIFIAVKMMEYKSWKTVKGHVNDKNMVEFEVDSENYSIPAVGSSDKEGQVVTVYYHPNHVKSTATTQGYVNWKEIGWYVLAFMWCFCILTGFFTWLTFKSKTFAKVAGGADLVNNILNPGF